MASNQQHRRHTNGLVPAARQTWLILLLLCLFSWTQPATATAAATATTAIIKGGYINASGVHTPSRFAYVALHYEGTTRDDEYLLGLRVLIRSVQLTNTAYDFVVLLSDNVRESTRQRLLDDGCVVKQIENLPNPFKDDMTRRNSYKPRFEFTFNKLYLWSMLDYERVLYLDSDNIALSNTDELFYCAHFCVVFMNPLLFHTGLMVVKPEAERFQLLLQQLQSPSSVAFSHDGADQGFLVTQFDVENAPIFDPKLLVKDSSSSSSSSSSGSEQLLPFEHTAMRLPMGYNMNHMYWYPFMSWSFFRHTDYSFAQHTIPALTIAYPAAPLLKPWYWWPLFFFTQHKHWHAVRATLVDDSHGMVVVTRLLLLLVLLMLSRYIVRPALTAVKPGVLLAAVKSRLQRLLSPSPWFIAYVLGVLLWLLINALCFMLIPATTPPLMAFVLFALFHVNLMFIALQCFTALVTVRLHSYATAADSDSSSSSSGVNSNLIVPWQSFAVIAGSLLMCSVFFLDVYPHFVPKVGVVVTFIFFWCVFQAQLFSAAAHKAQSKQMQINSS